MHAHYMGVSGLGMNEISLKKAKELAEKKNLKPGRVKGTDGVQFTAGNNRRVEVIDWNEFETLLEKNGLAIYESGGWMKIMRKKK